MRSAIGMLMLLLAATSMFPGEASAQDEPANVCTRSFSLAQDERAAGKLLRARQQLRLCADVSCPEAITGKCVPWLGEVEEAISTVVLSVIDDAGHDVSDVRVLVDGELVLERLEGRALELDPGQHSLRIERDGSVAHEQSLLVQQGVKNRLIEISLQTIPLVQDPPPKPPSAPSETTPPPVSKPPPTQPDDPLIPLLIVGFSVAAAGTAVGVIAAGVAYDKFDDIEAMCASATGCTEADIADGETIAHVATVGFVVAGIGAVVGVASLLLSGPEARVRSAGISPFARADVVGMQVQF